MRPPAGYVPTVTLIIAALGLVLTAGCSGKRFRQPSSAMAPTIQSNEIVVADMAAYETSKPQRWDVVVFLPPDAASRPPGVVSVMRVAGLPGESLEIRENGIYVDGKLVAQPDRIAGIHYVPKVNAITPSVSYPYKIPTGSYFVMGDNTTNCLDSRLWGPVPEQGIIGKVKGK
jgi:signal peptidase I